MTEKEEHQKDVINRSMALTLTTWETTWQIFKKHHEKNKGPIPAEKEGDIKTICFNAYAMGICCGMEGTIQRYDAILNVGKGGEE